MEKEVYIYVLKCPEGNVRYVGKTVNIKKRLSSHIIEARLKKSKRHVLHWVNSLLEENQLPTIEIIEICNQYDWVEKEQYWIQYYRTRVDNLCNICDGGLGGTGSKNYSKEELNLRASQASKRFSKFSENEKKDIWSLIKSKKSLEEIKNLYPLFTRHILFSVNNGRNWNQITNLPKTKGIKKRKGYTIRGKKYVVRNKNREVIFSSFVEQEVIDWLKKLPCL